MMGLHRLEDFPHGLVLFGPGESLDELFDFQGGGLVGRMVGPGPIEEPERLGAGGGAGAEDAVDELGIDGDAELVECALQVVVAADNVGDVMDGREVVVFGGGDGAVFGSGIWEGIEGGEVEGLEEEEEGVCVRVRVRVLVEKEVKGPFGEGTEHFVFFSDTGSVFV